MKVSAILLLLLLLAGPVSGDGDLWWTREPLPPGYCPPLVGAGWDGTLTPPLDGPLVIAHGRGYDAGHGGPDLATATGQPVRAAEDGVASWSGWSNEGGRSGGNVVVLAHGDGWQTWYGHLESVVVGCGQWVAAGEIIGYAGSSGTSWEHLHFEVRRGGVAVNPNQWLEIRSEPDELHMLPHARPLPGLERTPVSGRRRR